MTYSVETLLKMARELEKEQQAKGSTPRNPVVKDGRLPCAKCGQTRRTAETLRIHLALAHP